MIKGLLFNIRFSLPLKDPVLIFSLVLFIILLAPIILRKFRIPSIIGLILAGVAIGPYGFNLMERDSSIQLFGTVGLLYIMFLAGLELDLNEFKRNRNRSLLFGALTFSIPFGLGITVCHYFLHLPVISSVLIASMFSTHTLVAYPIASKLGLTRNEAVTIAVGGTIITDTVVLLILAVITGVSKGTIDQAFWIKLGVSLAVFVAVVFLLFPVIGRWFFKNIRGDNVSQYIFVLAMVFLAGFLAQMAGVEAIIGAFFAGLALNRLIPHTSPIMNRIEFVGNALFIPFFLIGVGMLVDLRVLARGPEALIIAGTLTAVAFLGKWLAAFFSQKIFRFSGIQRNVIFGLTSAHAAATLAVILIGFNIGLVDENILNGTIILILITCLVASFVTENAGRKLAIAESEQAPEMPEGMERILVPISNPRTIEQLMDFAIMLNDQRQKQPIYSLTVVKDDDEAGEKIRLSNKMLEKALVHAAATDSQVQIITRVDLNVVSGISRAVKEVSATDIIMGWNEKARTTDRLFGTTLGNVLEEVWQTVYVCRFLNPLSTAKRLIVVAPVNAEYEIGFSHWAGKVRRLSGEAGADIFLYAGEKTRDGFLRELEKNKSGAEVHFRLFEDMEDFLALSGEVTKDDMFIVIGARKGTISYNSHLENVQGKLNKYFRQNNYILVYPEQNIVEIKEIGMQSEDFTLTPIQEQIENLNRLGKTIKKIFKK